MAEKGKKTVLMISHQYTGVTGFANVTRRAAMALSEAGHEVYVIGQNYKGVPITPKETGNVTMLPSGADPWAADIFPFYMDLYKPDIVWTLTDIWACHYIFNTPKKWPWQWVRHITIDTENITPWWMDTIRQTDVPVAFSHMGQALMRQAGVDWGAYIPHGVDTNVYAPADPAEKAALREKVGAMEVLPGNVAQPRGKAIKPNDFIVLCVAHNQFRKNLDVMLRAFAVFSRDKDDAKLVLHCQPKDGLGWDIPQLIRKHDLAGKVFFTSLNAKMVADVFVTEKMMRDLYCLADVHMLLTGGEGFGIPYIESMACGIPNIATMWTTPKEFFADFSETEKDGQKELRIDMKRGILVPVDHVVEHHTGGEWGLANEVEAVKALELLYKNPEMRAKMGKAARDFAVENYDWAKITPKWVELIENADRYAKPVQREPVEMKLLDWKAG